MPKGIYERTERQLENMRKVSKGRQSTLGKRWKCKTDSRNKSKAMKGNRNGAGNFKNHCHSKKTKEKIRNSLIKYMQTHTGKFKDTDIETIIEQRLRFMIKKNIISLYKKQVRFERYLVDFYIPELNLIIECFGSYWHKGFAKKVRDMKKREYLEKLGYSILVLWDKEIKSKKFSLRRHLIEFPRDSTNNFN